MHDKKKEKKKEMLACCVYTILRTKSTYVYINMFYFNCANISFEVSAHKPLLQLSSLGNRLRVPVVTRTLSSIKDRTSTV